MYHKLIKERSNPYSFRIGWCKDIISQHDIYFWMDMTCKKDSYGKRFFLKFLFSTNNLKTECIIHVLSTQSKTNKMLIHKFCGIAYSVINYK